MIHHFKVAHLLLKSITGVCALTTEHSVFSIMAELIVEMLFSCSLFIMMYNGLKISEYEAYCLTDFPIIISWTCAKR